MFLSVTLTLSGLTNPLSVFTPPHFSLPPPQPPVVKTEMVTISDTFAAQKTEIATKEVPIVHTETKTITYEAAQVHAAATPGAFVHFLLVRVSRVVSVKRFDVIIVWRFYNVPV